MITSGYVSKIPVIELNEEIKNKLGAIAKAAYTERILPQETYSAIKIIDEILFKKLAFSKEIEADIIHFSSNLQTRV